MKLFVISDHHFGHANILNFKRLDGTPVRPEFNHVDDMNHFMIQQHNLVVSAEDKVYFLGDVAFSVKVFHEIIPQLKGQKRLILGNHDRLRMKDYLHYFKNIYSARYMTHNSVKLMLCHYPVHPQANYPNFPVVIHGHTHEKLITQEIWYAQDTLYGPLPYYETEINKNYVNVSVEQVNYTPVLIDDITKRFSNETCEKT